MGQTVWAGKLCAGGQGPGSCPVRKTWRKVGITITPGGQWGAPHCGGRWTAHPGWDCQWGEQHLWTGQLHRRRQEVTQYNAQKGSLQDVYAEVANYVGWINRTILANGGMSSCGHTIAADRTTNMASSTTQVKHSQPKHIHVQIKKIKKSRDFKS